MEETMKQKKSILLLIILIFIIWCCCYWAYKGNIEAKRGKMDHLDETWRSSPVELELM
jgi:hypothetical protein